LSFTFTQPTIDHTQQPAPATSVVAAVNYDRSPSLVDLSTQPNTPIEPHEFTSFAEASAAFSSWLPTCNWGKPPTLKRFWYESEKHLTPGVDFVSWGFREHPHWVGASNGEIVERSEENEELASLGPSPMIAAHESFAELQEFKTKLNAAFEQVRPAVAPEAMAALERSAAIAATPEEAAKQTAELAAEIFGKPVTDETTEVMIESGVCHCGEEMADHNITSGHSPVDMNIPLSMASPIQVLAHNEANGTNFPVPEPIVANGPATGPAQTITLERIAAANNIVMTACGDIGGEDQPGEGAVKPTEQTSGPTDQAPSPTIRLKYTEAEYADLRRRAEEDYAIELQRKENLYAEISMERAKAEDKVKALKAEEKSQLESLRFLKSEGPKYPKNPEVKVAADGTVANQEEGSPDAAATAPVSSDLDVTDERYQRYCALPLLPIVKDIKGLGSTKLSTLVDQYPTVGKLLEMQKEKGLQWYKAIGRGFGEELGSRIENAVGDALAKVQ